MRPPNVSSQPHGVRLHYTIREETTILYSVECALIRLPISGVGKLDTLTRGVRTHTVPRATPSRPSHELGDALELPGKTTPPAAKYARSRRVSLDSFTLLAPFFNVNLPRDALPSWRASTQCRAMVTVFSGTRRMRRLSAAHMWRWQRAPREEIRHPQSRNAKFTKFASRGAARSVPRGLERGRRRTKG